MNYNKYYKKKKKLMTYAINLFTISYFQTNQELMKRKI